VAIVPVMMDPQIPEQTAACAEAPGFGWLKSRR